MADSSVENNGQQEGTYAQARDSPTDYSVSQGIYFVSWIDASWF